MAIAEKTILVQLFFNKAGEQEDFAECKVLAQSAGANVVMMITGNRSKPDPKYFIGSGKAEEIRLAILATQAELVIVNHPLSPAQERNLERLFNCRVVDRAGLILDIFAQRARSFEGKLQVELAQLTRLATRLIRGWTHLERQKGGIGLRGPGETQLETDRRLIRNRIKTIKSRIEQVRMQRTQARRARLRAEIPTIAIVGYTNAGKSTLFNQLTSAEVYTADQLFATLDTTVRSLSLPPIGKVILSDTVGFIRDLPHELIDAFRATLEETKQAQLLVLVIDSTDPERDLHTDQVKQVLQQIGAGDIPRLEVYNKIDGLFNQTPRIDLSDQQTPSRVWVSALQKTGLDLLKEGITTLLSKEIIYETLRIASSFAKLRAELYELGCVIDEKIDEEGYYLLNICIKKKIWQRLQSEHQDLQITDK